MVPCSMSCCLLSRPAGSDPVVRHVSRVGDRGSSRSAAAAAAGAVSRGCAVAELARWAGTRLGAHRRCRKVQLAWVLDSHPRRERTAAWCADQSCTHVWHAVRSGAESPGPRSPRTGIARPGGAAGLRHRELRPCAVRTGRTPVASWEGRGDRRRGDGHGPDASGGEGTGAGWPRFSRRPVRGEGWDVLSRPVAPAPATTSRSFRRRPSTSWCCRRTADSVMRTHDAMSSPVELT